MSELKQRLSIEKRKQIEKLVVYAIAGLIGLVVMWLIFAPSGEDKELQSGFNTEMPDAVLSELVEDKQDAYLREKNLKQDADREQVKSIAEQLIKEDAAKVDVIPPSRGASSHPAYYQTKQEPKDKIIASTDAYRDMNKTLGSFYDTAPKVDTEKEQMQEQIDELRKQLALQAQSSMGVDEQIALMEKSYELAAKYMPSGEGESQKSTSRVTTPEIEDAKNFVNGKAQLNTIEQVQQRVVSTLSNPMSDKEFISEFSKERNWGFNTAVGKPRGVERNAISAVIHSDQTITDGQAVRIRLIQDMRIGDRVLPKSAIITGAGKIQGERLYIKISSIEHQGYIIPVELTVMDSDGAQGIFIPNSAEINALKEVAANLGSSMGTTINLNQQSAGDQILTEVGKGAIQGASQYVSKKMREVKVHLKAGYKLMLYQEKN